MSPAWRLVLCLTVALSVAEALFIVGLARQVGGLLLRLGPARAGQIDGGPEIGSVVEVPGLAEGTPTVVAFVSPQCEACKDLAPALRSVEKSYPELQLVAVVTGPDPSVKREYAAQLPRIARLDLEDLFELWNVEGTPFVVGLDGGGRVVNSGVANNLEHLEAFVSTTIDGAIHQHHHHEPAEHVIPEQELLAHIGASATTGASE